MSDIAHRLRKLTKEDWLDLCLVLFCILVFITQGITASKHKSASFDEQYHLSAGYSYLRTGDYRMATTHPPLIGLIAGTGLLPMSDITLPLDDPSWESGNRFRFSDVFVWERNDQSVRMIENGRIPIVVLLGALLVIMTAVWSRAMLGRFSMWMALALIAFEPNLVANSRIIATDFGVTVFLFMAAWTLWRWLQHPSAGKAVIFGVLAGMAMASKYSGVMIWPIALLILLIDPKDGVKSWRTLVRDGLIAFATALAALWMVYRMDVGWIQVGNLRLPCFAPFYWSHLLDTVSGLVDSSGAELYFVLGRVSQDGWWYYLPVAYLFKTPVALVIMTGLGFAAVAVMRQWRALSALWIPIAVFFALGVTGFVTLGYRHLLPVVPFTVMLAANSVNLNWSSSQVRRLYKLGLAALILWVAVGSLRFYPSQEANFNELAGRWTHWSEILVDSNLDWGQDLPALAEKMDELGIERVNLGYFGNAVPEKYGVRYNPLPGYIRFVNGYELNAYNPYAPEAGWYAVSATSLRLGGGQSGTENMYTYFWDKEPDARAGYSIYLYEIGYPPDTEWTTAVVVDETVAAYVDEVGSDNGNHVQARWLRSGDSEIILKEDVGRLPSNDYNPVDANFEDVFTLSAYSVSEKAYHPGESLDLQLYWRRGDGLVPMAAPTRGRPISVFVQVVNSATGEVVAQYDGWDTAMRGLQVGDVIRQAVGLDLPPQMEPGEYHVITGMYSPQTGQRLTVKDGDDLRDSIELFSFEITE